MRYSQILSFIDDHKIEGWFLTFSDDLSQYRKESGMRDDIGSREYPSHPLKDRPQRRALLFRQSGLPAEPPNVAISFPAFQLPCINNVLPFAEYKARAEVVATDF